MTAPGSGAAPAHVVHVVTDPGVPAFGRKGASVHVQALLREFVRRGARVDLVACRTGGDAPPGLEGVRVHELGRPSADDPAERERLLVAQDARAAALVGQLLADGPGGRALVYQRYALFSCEVLEAAARAGVPGVLEVNAPLLEEQAQHRVLVDAAGARERTARALLAAGAAYAVSTPVARWAEELVDGRRSVAVLPNGVDVARFAPPRAPHAQGPLTVAFVGTFRPWHGVDMLVEAAGELGREPGGRVRLLLVGDGPQRAAVLDRARDLGVEVSAPGAVDPGRVPALLAGADVAAAPYPAGAAYFSPLKVAEYLAAGLPTVAGAVSDLGTVLRDGEEVLLVPPGDQDALTTALRRLRDDPALRGRLASAGRAVAEGRLSWRAVTDDVLHLAAAPGAARPLAAAGPR